MQRRDAICCNAAAAAAAQGSGLRRAACGWISVFRWICAEVTDSIYTADGRRRRGKGEHDTQLQTHKREKEGVKCVH